MFALLCRLDSSLKASLAHDCGGHEVQLPHPTAENDEEAQMAVRGEYYQTGEKLASRGIKC